MTLGAVKNLLQPSSAIQEATASISIRNTHIFSGVVNSPRFVKMQDLRDGWSTNDLVNHMKDIHEVKETQPLSAGVWQLELHLIYSMDRKLGRKGGARTHPQQHYPEARSPRNFDQPHRKSTNNANSIAQPGQHQKAHNDINDIPPHPHTTVGRTNSPPHNQKLFTH